MWLIVISLCSCCSLVMALAFCLCWKKKVEKNELLGLEGMVTQKNPDENVNHLPSAAPQCVVDGAQIASGDNSDANKRTTIVSNPRRSLPDIPSEGQERSQGDAVAWDPSGDNSSDLYASVDQYQNPAKRQLLTNGEARPSISQHSSISQGDDAFSPYARVNYDQLHKQEHPYARLQNISNVEENSSEEPTPRTSLLRSETVELQQNSVEPAAPPRSRRSSSHSGLGMDISAATAVAGAIAANQELPYMTPPVAQTNFSGDSQDSSKGYTSISVREPLANIIAQTKAMNRLKRDLDPHYATVSDDSDDVYTTIPDQSNAEYTSGSETYARIPAVNITVKAEINAAPSAVQEGVELEQVHGEAPQPPSVDSLRQVAAHSHSRQASSSSSGANIGSPKPEKRQANSPLPPPPPPSVSPDITAKNLDDMYAKVHKNKKKPDDTIENDKSTIDTVTVDEKKAESETKTLRQEHNYETLRKSSRKCSDPGYEKIKPNKDCSAEPGYASINGPDSISSSDPGYEVLRQNAPSQSDPNYEELRGYTRIGNSTKDLMDGYSTVNKPSNSNGKSASDNEEPNYESMPSETASEHNYAALKSNGSESDPNYESVSHNDPNYESVKYLDAALEEPPYERLHDSDSTKSDGTGSGYEKVQPKTDCSGYETLNNGKEEKTEPPYERLSNDYDNKSDKNNENPGYETIKSADGEIDDDDGIVQV